MRLSLEFKLGVGAAHPPLNAFLNQKDCFSLGTNFQTEVLTHSVFIMRVSIQEFAH